MSVEMTYHNILSVHVHKQYAIQPNMQGMQGN